jgi:H/ACA ribonucleoprotein complex subunit 2
LLFVDVIPVDVVPGGPRCPLCVVEVVVIVLVVLLLQELGASGLSKRPTSCMLVLPKPIKGAQDDAEQKEFEEAYQEVEKKIKTIKTTGSS